MNIRNTILALLILGIGIFIYSLTLPYYTDEIEADLLRINYDKFSKEEYYKKEAELRTSKIHLEDLGSGIAIASLTLLLFVEILKIRKFSDLEKVRTLTKKEIFMFSNIVWLILILGTVWFYIYRLSRGDFPIFADSIGIPLSAEIPLYLLTLIPLNIFLIIAGLKSNLPTKLFVKAKRYTLFPLLWEGFFIIFIIINLFLFSSLMIEGDHVSIPVNMVFTYVLLSLRAGQISKY